jgi:serine/threonine-protein kinase
LAGGFEEMTLNEGTKVGRYEVRSLLGAGGMGEVYLARDTSELGRTVALKILPLDIAKDQDRLQRFTQEARTVSNLNHPNILTVYEFGQLDSATFIATEYIEGETLRHHIQHSRMKLREVLDVMIQVSSALSAAHQAGIIHRDIKPENIMLRPDGYVKVLDFGLAKLSEKSTPATDSEAVTLSKKGTDPGTIMGTVQYMSPEQARGKVVDARTDIFSLGIMLYELIAGRAPFTGESSTDVLAAILDKEPLPLLRFVDDLPTELQRIVQKCLRKERDERYQTMKDVLLDLRELRDELVIEAKLERSLRPASNIENQPTLIADGEKTREEAVQQTNSASPAQPTSSAGYLVGATINHKRGVAVAVLMLLFAIFGAGYWFIFLRSANPKQIESIAVLPFENGSGNSELEYLSDGVSESVLDRLSQLPQLKVIARSSSFRYRGENLDLKQIAGALGVQAVVTGRVVRRGEAYVIRVDVTDVGENKQLWGENFTRQAADVQILQTEIARAVAENLRVRLSGTQTQQLAIQGTTHPQAYEFVLKGNFYRNKGGTENLKKAIECFQQAITLDPNYVLAYTGLADTHRATRDDPKVSLPIREAALRKGLELNNQATEAHFSMGQYQRDLWHWQEAEREYRLAIELNPNNAHAYSGLSGLLSLLGRFDEALAAGKRAGELDPVGVIINTVAGRTLHFARHHDEAIDYLKKTVALDTSSPISRLRLGDVYVTKGMYAEAITEYQQTIQLGDTSNEVQIHLGAAYAKMGERGRALEILKRLQSSDIYVPFGDLAILYAALGESDQAFASFERGYAEHSPSLQFLKVNPAFDSLRSDPRFQDLLRRMGLPQ